MNTSTWILSATLVVGALAAEAQASDSRLYVHERALNAVAEAVGSQTFSGTQTIRAPDYPCVKCKRYAFGVCVQLYTTTCEGPVLVSAGWSATVDDVEFQITYAGASFKADLHATFGGFVYDTEVQGFAHVDLDDEKIRFRVNNISVPLVFVLPVMGATTIATLSLPFPMK